MKIAFLAVIVLLVTGGLFVWVRTPILPASTSAVRSFDAPSSGSVWWVGASSTDSSALPNTGVQGKIQVISTSVVGCLAFWVSDDLLNNVWGQVGYYICDTSTPLAFYQIWNLDTNAVLTSGSKSVSTGSHTFSMYLQSGTTWAYSLDGTVFGTYDMGASTSSSSYPVYALSEEEANSTFAFPTVGFSTALQVMESGSWNPVQTAESYGTGWGLAGAAQGTGLQANQITVGGSLAALPQGTQLWSTGTTSTTSSSGTSTSSSTSTSSTATLPPVTSTVTSTKTSTATSTATSISTSTVTSVSTSTVTSTTAKTTTSITTSPTTMTSTVTATQTATDTVSSTSTVTSPPTTTTQTVTTTSTVTPPVTTSTLTTTQTSTRTVASVSTVTLPQTTTVATQTGATTDTQTVTSTLTLNHTSTVTTPLTVTSTTISTSIQPTTVTETNSSQVATTATETVPSTVAVTRTLSETPAASATCSNRTGPLSNPRLSTAGTSAVLPSISGGSALAVLAASLTGLALIVRRHAHSLIPRSPRIKTLQSSLVPRSANSLFEGRRIARERE